MILYQIQLKRLVANTRPIIMKEILIKAFNNVSQTARIVCE
jgi:hypothetical protein